MNLKVVFIECSGFCVGSVMPILMTLLKIARSKTELQLSCQGFLSNLSIFNINYAWVIRFCAWFLQLVFKKWYETPVGKTAWVERYQGLKVRGLKSLSVKAFQLKCCHAWVKEFLSRLKLLKLHLRSLWKKPLL